MNTTSNNASLDNIDENQDYTLVAHIDAVKRADPRKSEKQNATDVKKLLKRAQSILKNDLKVTTSINKIENP